MSILDTLFEKGLTAFGKVQVQTRPPLVRAAHCRRMMGIILPGDIICRKYDCYADRFLIPGEFTHSGIVESSQYMIHAVAEGVERIDVLDFVKDTDGFIVLRPGHGYDPKAAVEYARAQLGKPYDFKFQAEAGPVVAFFCHELSARSVQAGGIKIIPVLKQVGPVVHEVYVAQQFIDDPVIATLFRTEL